MVKKPKNLNGTKKHLALISPLDWGLGHTTRCIPIIRELLLNNFEIVIACDTTQKSVLSAEFPDLKFENFPGYGLKYGRTRVGTLLRLAGQAKYILTAIKREKRLLSGIVDRYQPDLIISDNRYGFCFPGIKSIIITHQLNVLTGFGRIVNHFVNRSIRRYLAQFDECWVPDFAEQFSLAGKLAVATPGAILQNTRYIGPLSRFENCVEERCSDLLIILSGPEPQRSILERKLLSELALIHRKTVLVRGTNESVKFKAPPDVEIISLASATELNKLVCRAEIVISRTGYTSVMDLLKLRKKLIMIPTPGQAEQEYLGKHLASGKYAVVTDQEKIDLGTAILLANELIPPDLPPMDDYKKFCTAEYLFEEHPVNISS